jgi:hypothetical protein
MAELVCLSSERFPRLRQGGRLVWLGPHGEGVNYHDPDKDGELVALGPDEGDGSGWVTDTTQWCPALPDGVYISGVIAIGE